MENNAAPDTFTILVVEDNEELKAFLKNIALLLYIESLANHQ